MCVWEQGLLALEGELTPILVQMVKSANMNGLLDNDSDSLSSCQHRVKARLHEILQKDRDFIDEDYDRVISTFTAEEALLLICWPLSSWATRGLLRPHFYQISERVGDICRAQAASRWLWKSCCLNFTIRTISAKGSWEVQKRRSMSISSDFTV